MKFSTLTAVTALVASPAFAEGPPAMGAGGPPPIVATQMNLGPSGLLVPFYSDLQYGATQGRVAESRARINTIENGPPGTPSTGYENATVAVAAPWVFRKMISGSTNLTFKAAYANVDAAPGLVSDDATHSFGAVGIEHAYSPDGMFALELGYRVTDVERSTGTFALSRESIDFRAAVAQKLSNNWGAVGRLIYSDGESDVDITTPGGVISQTIADYSLYTEANLVGTFTSEDLSMVPNGWVLHPTLGVSYLRNSADATTDSMGHPIAATSDDFGAVFALATLEKQLRPGGFAPSFQIGIEDVFKDDLSAYSDETTYGIIGAGVGYMNKSGATYYVGYQHREGFNGERSTAELTIAGNITF